MMSMFPDSESNANVVIIVTLATAPPWQEITHVQRLVVAQRQNRGRMDTQFPGPWPQMAGPSDWPEFPRAVQEARLRSMH